MGKLRAVLVSFAFVVSLLAVLAGDVAAAVTVRGDSRCPTPAQVTALLAGMLPARSDAGPQDVVEVIAHSGGGASVRLGNAGNQTLAEKRVPDTLSCAERARAAAVIVAAWQAQFAAPSEAAVGRSVTPPPLAVAPQPAAAPAPLVVAPRGSVDMDRPKPLEVELGAAVLASVAAGALSPGLALDARIARAGARYGLGVSAMAIGTHEVAVGTARGAWRRYGGALDLRAGARAGAIELDLRTGAVLTALAIDGAALPLPSGATVFDPGALVGLRLRRRVGALAPWLEATAIYWPRTHDLFVSGLPLSQQVPVFETWLAAGVSLGPDR